jgi:predicted lipoprotein with Yx(FWY)xxD motif
MPAPLERGRANRNELARSSLDTDGVRRYVIVCLAVAAAGGCGDEDRQPSVAPTPTASSAAVKAPDDTSAAPAAQPRKRGIRIKAIDSQFGTILGNGRGQAVYYFDKEQSRRSECYGDCARAWPPVLTKGRPVAGKRARRRLLGTTRRRGGKRQVTYRGRPLYYYVDDRPGLVLCHNVLEFGGLWLVVRPDGTPVA